jgi:CBS domain-containing protein/sporulation protein YlmC with PRC-barrel domain
MAYLSDLIGKPVADVDGRKVGRLSDVYACTRGRLPLPEIVAVSVRRGRDTVAVPISQVAVLIAPAVPLTVREDELAPYQPGEHDVHLVRDVLDKQIIDTNGVRVVRVNDLEITRVNHQYFVANVDIGYLGIFRRLGLSKAADKYRKRFGGRKSPNIISWDDIELLPGGQPMRLKVSGDKIAELHPADLAEILSDLNRTESNKFLEALDVKTVADALEEVEPDFQASLVESMPDEKVADILEEMAPDEAADLLAELPEDRSDQLLKLMEHEDAEDVRKLLTYPEDTAGGIMTTEYVDIDPDLTTEQAIAVLRENAEEAETIFYVYVTDADNRLLGVFSLSDLVLAKPGTPVKDFLHGRVVSVLLEASQDEVAQVIAKYNLLAVPVVDEQDRLHGIVTADDALDKIIPTKWKKRLPRLYH